MSGQAGPAERESRPEDLPPTVLEILNRTERYLRGKGVENPRLDAQLLLGHALGLKRLELYLNFDRPLSQGELEACRRLVQRRGRREPLQHILGEVCFRELRLKVDGRALIPRQETELLVDWVKRLWEGRTPPRILEVGVGTGAICLSLLKEMPGAEVYGVEISRQAAELARENADLNGLTLSGRLYRGDVLQALCGGGSFDCVVSNPPYVSERELSGLAPEVRDHDPAPALIGGPEGWEFPWRLIREAIPLLRPGGWLVLEIGAGQAETLKQKAGGLGWSEIRSERDYGRVERFLAFRR